MASLTTTEKEAVQSVPAVLVNRVFVSAGMHGVRLAFAEQSSEDLSPMLRSAVVMTVQDALALCDLIRGMFIKPADETAA